MTTVKLGDVCEVVMGQAPPGDSYNSSQVGVPLLAGAGDFGPMHPKPKRFTTAPTLLSREGDILLCVRATVGDRNWSDRSYCLGRGVASLRPRPGELEPRYLWHWLGWERGTLERRARGSTFKQVTRKAIESLPLRIPPIGEQQRIAELLDTAEAVRRKRQEGLQLLEGFQRTAYAFVAGSQNGDYSQWPEVSVADVAAQTPGAMRTGPFGSALRHSEFVGGGVAVLGIDNAVLNRFAWDERRYISEEKYESFRRYTVKPGDVIVTIMGTTGRSSVVPKNIPPAISTKHLAVITVDRKRVHPLFLSHALHSDPAILAQISATSRGAIMPGLNLGIIKRLRLRLPPLSVQERFASLIEGVTVLRDNVMLANNVTSRLFESLAHQSFS